jgi:hypothetical protein
VPVPVRRCHKSGTMRIVTRLCSSDENQSRNPETVSVPNSFQSSFRREDKLLEVSLIVSEFGGHHERTYRMCCITLAASDSLKQFPSSAKSSTSVLIALHRKHWWCMFGVRVDLRQYELLCGGQRRSNKHFVHKVQTCTSLEVAVDTRSLKRSMIG